MTLVDLEHLGVFAAYCLPLPLLAVVCFLGRQFVKRKLPKILLLVLAVALGATGAVFAAGMGSYIWALHLESKWMPAHPKTRAELESHLSLYRTRSIQPKDSMWGHRHELKDGERMLQYVILWDTPLDVVYDRDDRVVFIYTSYE